MKEMTHYFFRLIFVNLFKLIGLSLIEPKESILIIRERKVLISHV